MCEHTIDWIKLTNGINTPINFVKKNCITVIIHIDSWINKQLAYNLHGHRTIIITTTTAAEPHVFQTPMQFKLIGQLFSFVMVSMEEILLFVLFQILCSFHLAVKIFVFMNKITFIVWKIIKRKKKNCFFFLKKITTRKRIHLCDLKQK